MSGWVVIAVVVAVAWFCLRSGSGPRRGGHDRFGGRSMGDLPDPPDWGGQGGSDSGGGAG